MLKTIKTRSPASAGIANRPLKRFEVRSQLEQHSAAITQLNSTQLEITDAGV